MTNRRSDYPCNCSVLEDAAADPYIPISFDVALNEYHIEHKGRDGHMMIYHCPFCGGRPPTSRRDRLFARVTVHEHAKLLDLTKDIRTLEDAIRTFGTPDSDMPQGTRAISRYSEEKPQIAESYRTLRYEKLSDTADVSIVDELRDKVRVQIYGKYIGANELTRDDRVTAEPEPAASNRTSDAPTLYCSFCSKSQHDVAKLVAGRDVFICDECVLMCLNIVQE
jgi:hypothetical protein